MWSVVYRLRLRFGLSSPSTRTPGSFSNILRIVSRLRFQSAASSLALWCRSMNGDEPDEVGFCRCPICRSLFREIRSFSLRGIDFISTVLQSAERQAIYCGSGPSELDPLRFWSRIMFSSIRTAAIAAIASTAPITVTFMLVAPIPQVFRTLDMRTP